MRIHGSTAVGKLRARDKRWIKFMRRLSQKKMPDLDQGLNQLDIEKLEKLLQLMITDGRPGAYDEYRPFFAHLFPTRVDVPRGMEHLLRFFSFNTISYN